MASTVGNVAMIAAIGVAGLLVVERFSPSSSSPTTTGTTATTSTTSTSSAAGILRGLLPPISNANVAKDAGLIGASLVNATTSDAIGAVGTLITNLNFGNIAIIGLGVQGLKLAWYYQGTLIGYFVKSGVSGSKWAFQQVVNFISSFKKQPPSPPSPPTAPAPVTSTAPQTVQQAANALARMKQALGNNVAPAARDAQTVANAIANGVVTSAQAAATLGPAAWSQLQNLAGSISSLGPLVNQIAIGLA